MKDLTLGVDVGIESVADSERRVGLRDFGIHRVGSVAGSLAVAADLNRFQTYCPWNRPCWHFLSDAGQR